MIVTNDETASGPDAPPAPVDAAGAKPQVELLAFRCGGQRYAVDIMDVREIRSWSQPTPLPHAPPYMRGMVNLRGMVLPVMDLAQRLGLPPTRDDPRNVIVVVQQGRRVHGLLVEAVSDIVHAGQEALQDIPKLGGDGASMAERLLVQDDEMIQVLATARILPPLGGVTEGAAA